MQRRTFLQKTGMGLLGLGLGMTGFPCIASGAKGELVVYAWYQNFLRKVIPDFEKETGIKVKNLGGYSKDDEWWAKLQVGESFDFIIPGGNRVETAITAGLLQPLDLSKLPNYQNLEERVQNIPEFMSAGKHYVVPFTQVIYSLFYNTNQFSQPPESWKVCWDEKYKGKITMNDRARQTIAIASLILGDDPNNPTKWEETKKLLLEQKPLVLKYWTDHQATMEMLARQEAWIGMFTDGRTRMAKQMGAPVAVHIPNEGAMMLIDSFAIPSTAKNVEEAYTFINFLLKPESALLEMELMHYDSMNKLARAELSEERKQSFNLSNIDKLVLLKDVSPALKQRLDELWLEIKLG